MKYHVQYDGQDHIIEGPEGATEEQLMWLMANQFANQQAEPSIEEKVIQEKSPAIGAPEPHQMDSQFAPGMLKMLMNSNNPVRNSLIETLGDADKVRADTFEEKHGFRAPTSWNPMVHLGKTLSDLSQIRHIMPFTDEMTQEEYDKWNFENTMYNSGNQPASMQILGDFLPGATSFATPLAKLGIGQVLKSFGKKKAGEKLAHLGAFGASETGFSPMFPALAGGIEGSLHGASIPQNPSLDDRTKFINRMMNTIEAGALGAGVDTGVNYGLYKGQQGAVRKARKEASGTLPHPVQIPPSTLFDIPADTKLVNQIAGQSGVGRNQQNAARIMYNQSQSILDNFDEINFQATGIRNDRVGHSMTPVMDEFMDSYKTSKNNMDLAYEGVKQHGEVEGVTKEFKQFLKGLKYRLLDKGIPLDDSVDRALKNLGTMQKMGNKGQGHYDAHHLVTRYKMLNTMWGKANNDADRRAIGEIRDSLADFMESAEFRGDSSGIDEFLRVTREVARPHYQKFHGDPTIDKFINGDINTRDVSRRIFSGDALDYTEAPKVKALDKIMQVVPESKNRLGNEAFANLTDELGRTKVDKALPVIQRRMLSGNEEGIYGRLFDDRTIKQFEDLKMTMDKIQHPKDPGLGKYETIFHGDIFAAGPQRWLADKTGYRNYLKMFRMSGDQLAPTGMTARGFTLPATISWNREEKEEIADKDINKILREIVKNKPRQKAGAN